MPLLKSETEIFPAEIFEPGGAPWRVAHTRSRQEKVLARYLEPRGVAFYLPYRQNRSVRGGRSFVSHLPLFPGYVFFRGEAAERGVALRSHLLVRVLDVPDQQLLDQELAQLRSLQLAGAQFTPLVDLEPGDAVRIVDGPFRGYTGIVLADRARVRLVVSITMLRRTVAVELQRDAVAPVSSYRRDSGTRSAVA